MDRWIHIPSSQDRLGVQPTATDSEIRTSTDGDQLAGLGEMGDRCLRFFYGMFCGGAHL